VRYLHCLLGLALGFCLAHPGLGEEQQSSAPGVACSDWSACRVAFDQNLERLRQIIGGPKPPPLTMNIRSATPYDIYFQTVALWQMVNRLAFEILRVAEKPLPTPPAEIQLSAALHLVQEAYRVLQEVMADPQIAESNALLAPAPAEPVSTSVKGMPADAFMAIFAINRQLNVLLERPYAPSDIYREVTLAVAYAAQLLARYPEADRLPEEPPFEPAKQPADVYLRLLACLNSLAQVSDTLGLAASHVESQDIDKANIIPGDVFLLASLIVAQLDFLHHRLGITQAPRQVFYPGHKFPSHVYQRAGMLQVQLQQLEQRVIATGSAPGKD
jgi:hypothetical protein